MSELTFTWGHVNINVSNLDRSVAFYEKLGFVPYLPGIPYLGLEEGAPQRPIPPDAAKALGFSKGASGRACILQLGEDGGFPKIDLTELGDAGGGSPPLANADRGLVRLCLLSRDVGEAYERLSADGVEFLSPPQAGEGGMATLATCKDPDGTLIELLEIHRDKWRARSR